MFSRLSPAVRRGLQSGLTVVFMLAIATVPSRLQVAMRGHGGLLDKGLRLVTGATLDLSAAIGVFVFFVLVLTAVSLAIPPFRRSAFWQHLGAPLLTVPVGFGLYLLAITAQEVKAERGAFPTMFDLAEGSNASFVAGSVQYIQLPHIWVPFVVGGALVLVTLVFSLRRRLRDGSLVSWRGWSAGFVAALAFGCLAAPAVASVQAKVSNRASPAFLGDPLTGIVESSFDMVRHRSAATPRELIEQIELPAGLEVVGARRLGWPAPNTLTVAATGGCAHPHARPLDFETEAGFERERGAGLVRALQRVSAELFTAPDSERMAFFQMSLESFRADDLQALNPEASPLIDPFVNALYARARHGGAQGVLASSKMMQAGVRTAQGLGALTCGVGTLPYNLSLIRDLQPFAMRCAGDVLHDAGFEGSFFYGSDATFDAMDVFLKSHGYATIKSQAELPETLPKGAWAGLTDFAVFDQAVEHMRQALGAPHAAPHFSLLMSLSNHSPFTTPEDLPNAVVERVKQGLSSTVNRADDEDRRRLYTHSYTDAAVERFFGQLDSTGLAERSLVVLSADHSTGESYVWGPVDPETDAAKAQIPFVVVIPSAWLQRVPNRPALEAALNEAQALLDEAPLSQNDVPTLVLALLSAHPGLKNLAPAQRWHTLGGQVTSPWFDPGGDGATFIYGINGVSEFYALDRTGARVGDYEDSVFLKTRADRYRVTPTLIPAAATVAETIRACPGTPP